MKAVSIIMFLLLSHALIGQYQIGLIPRVSPDKGVFQKIGYTEVEIQYGSPSVNGREVWGNLVQYDEVWRAGANNATTIEFSTDVIIEGQKLEKGKYSFFIIPQENKKWIAIFNKEHKQWGAFDYNKESDALRVEIVPNFNNNFIDKLTYSISNYGFQFGTLNLEWENVKIQIEIDTDYILQFKNEVESRIEKADENIHWVIYLQGAEHLENINTNLDLANTWIGKSEATLNQATDWNKQYYPKKYIRDHLFWTKAKLLSKQGDYNDALTSAQSINIEDGTSLFHKRKNKSEDIDNRIKEWKKKVEEDNK